MICPSCKNNVPDGSAYCNHCGIKLQIDLKACTNVDCPDFGKYLLPLDSKFCPSCGKQLEDTIKKDSKVLELTVNGVTFNMILVKVGSFMMGVPDGRKTDSADNKPMHQVILTNDYYIGETLVTQALWKAVMGNNPAAHIGDNLPVENVSWIDCQKFINMLNHKTGKTFRLPTEAEWEFAARGGIESKGYIYSGSDNLKDVGWCTENSNRSTHEVKTKKSNELGIYDMSGNVWEWCSDFYHSDYYKYTETTNPIGRPFGKLHVFRGGAYKGGGLCCEPIYRGANSPEYFMSDLGLRLAICVDSI